MCLHSAVLLVTSPVSGGPLPELHYEAVSLSRGQGGDQVSSRNAPWGGGPSPPLPHLRPHSSPGHPLMSSIGGKPEGSGSLTAGAKKQ